MKRIAAFVATVALALTGCATTGAPAPSAPADGTANAEPTTVRVAHLPSTLFSPLYIAAEKGYFTDAGLTVELEAVKSGQDAIPLLASGKLDALAAGFSAGMFNARNEGLEFQIVGSMGVNTGDPANSPTMLLAGQQGYDAGTVTSVADLKGKKVAAAGGPGATGGFLTASILATAGLTLNDVEIVNLSTPDMPNALSTGAVDAALASAPTSGRIVADKAGTAIGVPAKGVSSSGLMFGPEFAETAAAQAFFDAVAKGAADLQGDGISDEDNLAILAKATNQEVDAIKALPFYTFDAKLAPQPATIEQMQTIWMEGGQIDYDTPLTVDELVNDAFTTATP
ncbi:MAG: ABC transporter substrate-binding protein [Propionibacteriaceae bacterium]|nr:ABC transporter substrate-binding protein [Propionibacteriaceae bacterium]